MHAAKDLKSYYHSKLANAGRVFDESIAVKRKLMKTITKLLPFLNIISVLVI